MLKRNRILILLIIMIFVDSYARFAHNTVATGLAILITLGTLIYVIVERLKRH